MILEEAYSIDINSQSKLVNHADEIGHTDLQWSVDIDLQHLEEKLIEKIKKN